MIRITHVPPPKSVADKAQAVTDQIATYLQNRQVPAAAAGQKKPKDKELAKLVKQYSDERLGLKKHLFTETHEKCAYCESMITHVDYGDIEHIVPKSVRPDLATTLANLTVACGVCNTNKSDYYNQMAPLIDPHNDDCRHEIVFFGWDIAKSFCGGTGQHTLRELELNREPLSRRREDQFNKLGEIISSWRKEVDATLRYALLLTIWDYAVPTAEYSSMALTVIDQCQVERP